MTSSPGSSPTATEQSGSAPARPAGTLRGALSVVGPVVGSVAGWVVLAPAGFFVALAGLFVSRLSADLFGIGVPYGLVLMVACLAAVLEAGRELFGFAGVAVAGGGWLVGAVVVLWPRPAGDVLVAEDGYGIGYCLLGLLSVVGLAYHAKSVGTRRSGG